MFSIGEFARLGAVSIRTLRHYDEIGLLPPAEVDPASGYRSYSAKQNGTRWAVMASPSPSKLDNVLFGVATLSATSAWAVGYDSVSVHSRTYHRARSNTGTGAPGKWCPRRRPGPAIATCGG